MNTIATAKRPPPYEVFFATLKILLSPQELESVEFAYQASKHGHAEQKRDDGSRYFDHPKAAAWIYVNELGGHDCRVIIDTLTHDLPEDSALLSPYRLKLNFGIDIALDVSALSKYKYAPETTAEYLARIIARGPWAIVAKLSDRLHNNRTLSACTPEKQREQAEETVQYHLAILIPELRKFGGVWAQYADTFERLMREAIAPHLR